MKGGIQMLGMIVRFIVSALVLLVVGYLIPGVSVAGFWGALITAVVIAVLGYIVEAILGDKISPRSRGIVGFLTAAVVIYITQFIVPNYFSVSLIGALLAAFVIGLIDAFVPTELR
jgi:putative membrane protein